MEKKIKDLETLLKEAAQLAGEIASEASEAASKAHEEYRTNRYYDDIDTESMLYERYRKFLYKKGDSERVETELKGILTYNLLFK